MLNRLVLTKSGFSPISLLLVCWSIVGIRTSVNYRRMFVLTISKLNQTQIAQRQLVNHCILNQYNCFAWSYAPAAATHVNVSMLSFIPNTLKPPFTQFVRRMWFILTTGRTDTSKNNPKSLHPRSYSRACTFIA